MDGNLMRKIERKHTRHNVISRKDNLLMVPSNPDLKSLDENNSVDNETNGEISVTTKIINNKVVSVATFKREFELGDVLDYLKTGIACIIEDEVTQRFVQAELKTWNLMTRTNKSFVFINWRITCIWIFGCWVRYFLLFPARLVVLLLGVGFIPDFPYLIPYFSDILAGWLMPRAHLGSSCRA
jgi:glycerol-3-phosphate O-acyltransferase 3/4